MEDLLAVFANHLRALDMVYLLNNLKPAVRLDANPAELPLIRDFCQKNNLSLEQSDFKLIKEQDQGKGGFSNKAHVVPLSHPEPGVVHLYISKDPGKSKLLKIAEAKHDHKAEGILLGYPSCCIDFFKQQTKTQEQQQNDYILPAVQENNNFPFENNVIARYFGYSLLSHFPHRFDCERSLHQGKQRFDFLQKNYPETAKKIEQALTGAFLYTERDGVFKLEQPITKKDHNQETITFTLLQSTTDNNFKQQLTKEKMFFIKNSNFFIGTTQLNDVALLHFS